MDYSGKIITKNAVTPTQTAASGVWTLDDALQAQKGNNWPIPGVLNPISKSLRFNSADSAYLNRTPAIAGNRKKWTWSSWVKRSGISAEVVLFRAVDGIANFNFYFTSSNTIATEIGATNLFTSTPVYRDVSAWYHIVLVFDSDNATADNRFILYVNGVSQAKASGSVSSGLQLPVNGPFIHYIGGSGSDRFINAYLTEINFVDGQALTPSDFGMTDTNTGVWIPKKYTGTYGINGFYVNFKDATNTSTLGLDYSGNGNNWNANNFSVTAGAGNDSLTDVPTPWVGYSLNGDTGGVVRGNYCTLNPLKSKPTLSNGNLYAEFPTTTWYTATSTIAISSGKWYWEVTWGSINNSSTYGMTGIVPVTFNEAIGNYPGYDVASFGYFSIGQKYNNGTPGVYGTSYTNDTIGVALDMDAGTIVFYKNGVSQGTAYTGLAPATFTPAIATYGTNATVNFGQRPFAYTPPAGFLSLCTTNLPTPTIGATSTTQAGKYFNTVLYTGDSNSTGATRSVTGVGFQPDFVWLKTRTDPYSHQLYDAVRGTGSSKNLSSDRTVAEGDSASLYGYVSAFQTDGFQTTNGTDGANSGIWVNALNENFVAWNWKANGAGSSNTAGSITSTVSANTTAGFSIVTWTGNGTQGATVGHGLGAVPALLIFKNRSVSATEWPVKTNQLATNAYLYLNATNASASYSFFWSAEPTSSLIYLGSDNRTNGSGNLMVCYAFAPVAGYSAFGSYTGNGSADGPFIYTGFRPAFVLIKATSSVSFGSWRIIDNKRSPSNVAKELLFPNLSNAEDTADWLDLTSNGFKIRQTSDGVNGNGSTYIYAAFAESPFKFANAR